MVSGILVLDKPAGATSFQMVRLVRRQFGIRRVGHAGTLDPLATGVLPICIGQATKVVQFLLAGHKVYEGWLRLGVETDTYDVAGRVVAERVVPDLSHAAVERAARHFLGPILQAPPFFSAVKHHGQPLYRLARRGVFVEKEPRQIEVFELDVLEVALPLVHFRIHCTKGTYVRSLVHDLGELLGCGASLQSLRRLKSGPFEIDQAVTVEDMDQAASSGVLQTRLYPLEAALAHIPELEIEPSMAEELRLGRPVSQANIFALARRQQVGPSEGLPYLKLLIRRSQDRTEQGMSGPFAETELVSVVAWPTAEGEAQAERVRTLRVWTGGPARLQASQ